MDRQKIVEEAGKKGVDMSWLQQSQQQSPYPEMQQLTQTPVPDLDKFSPMASSALQGGMLTDKTPAASTMMEQAQARQQPVKAPYAPGTPTQATRDKEMFEKYRVQLDELNKRRERAANVEANTAQQEGSFDEGPSEPMATPAEGFVTERAQITPNFHASEFACKGTGKIKVSRELVNRLQALRDYLGVPISVTSGYRSREHNASIPGAAPNSRHISGEAADIVAQGVSMQQLAAAAKKFFGDGGIGTYGGHVHVDVGPQRRW